MRRCHSCVTPACLAVLLLAAAGCTRKDVQSARAVEDANRLVKERKYDEATELYQRAVQLNPRNGEAYYRLGLLAWELGRGRSIESNLVRAVDLQPSNMDALSKLSELYLLSYRHHNDPKWRQRYMTEMGRLATQMLQVDPRSPDGQRIQGYLAFFKGDYPSAANLFDAVLQARPDAPYAAELMADKVTAMLKQGRIQDAQAAADLYLASHPGATGIYDALATFYRENNQSEAALEALRRKADANPQNIGAVFDLASAYRAAGRERDMERALDTIRNSPERFPNGYELLANFYARTGDYNRAMQSLRAGQAAQPNRNLDYLYRECELLIRQRRFSEANQLLRSAGAPPSSSIEQRIARQALLAQLGFPEGVEPAISELKALASKAPQDARVQVALGRALQKQGKVEEASVAFEQAAFLAPDSAEVFVAQAQFFQSRGDFAKMGDVAERALVLERDSPGALLARGIAMSMLGQVPAASRDLTAVQKQWPNDPEVIHHIALLDARQGRERDAEAGLQRAAAAGYVPSILSLSDIYIRQNRPDLALQILRPVIAAGKTDAQITLAHARAAAASGDYPSAIGELKQLVAQNPNNGSASLELISALQRSGDSSAALAVAQAASKANSRNPDVLARCADLTLAAGGSKVQAKSLLETALREQPDHPAGARLVCLILEMGGDRTEALSLAQRMSRSSLDDPGAWSCITRAFVANGLNEQALRLLQAAVQKQPESVPLRLELAQAYLIAGDKPKSRSELQAAARMKPTPQQAAQIQEALEKLGTASQP